MTGPGKVSGGSESTSSLAGRDSSELPLLNDAESGPTSEQGQPVSTASVPASSDGPGSASLFTSPLEAGWSNEPGVWVDGEKTGDYHEADDEGEALAPRLDRFYDERFFDDPEHRDHALDGPGPGAPEWEQREWNGEL